MNISLFMSVVFFASQLGFDFDINSPGENIRNENQEIFAAKKKKFKKAGGTYQGTFILSKVKSFNGATCNPTDSFPSTIIVSQTKKKVSGQINNLPFSVNGKANKKGFRTKGVYTSGTTKRNYVLVASKVKSASGNFKLTETIRIGGVKGCVFAHQMKSAARS